MDTIKKILGITIILFVLTTCSSDDDAVASLAGNGKLLDKLFHPNKTDQVFYNSGNTVQYIRLNNNLFITPSYINQKISQIEISNVGTAFYTHDSEGIINSVTHGGNTVDIIYNPVERSYQFLREDIISVIYLNQLEMIEEIIMTDINSNEQINHFKISYDEQHYGPFYNNNDRLDLYISMLNPTYFPELSFLLSKYPIEIFTFNQNNVLFDNEYDEDGFIKRTTFDGSTYGYQYLIP